MILCETSEGCTCGAPASTPAGMHHDDCVVRSDPMPPDLPERVLERLDRQRPYALRTSAPGSLPSAY